MVTHIWNLPLLLMRVNFAFTNLKVHTGNHTFFTLQWKPKLSDLLKSSTSFSDYYIILHQYAVPEHTIVSYKDYLKILNIITQYIPDNKIARQPDACNSDRYGIYNDNSWLTVSLNRCYHYLAWKIIEHLHPPYSPDLSSCVYFLLHLLNAILRNHSF